MHVVIAVITENSKYKSLQSRRAYCPIDLVIVPDYAYMVIIYNQSAFTPESTRLFKKTQLKHAVE